MKKITGKALSLVLSLALVVSSFSASFAFASTKTMSGIVNKQLHDDLYLVNGGTDRTIDLNDALVDPAATLQTSTRKDVDSAKVAAISHVSGSSLVSLSLSGTDDETATLKLKSSTADGTEVISVLYSGDYTDDDGNEYTVKARKNVTVHVYDKDSVVFGEAGFAGGSSAVDFPDDFKTFAKTKNFEKGIGIYVAEPTEGSTPSAAADLQEVYLTSKLSGTVGSLPTSGVVYSISVTSGSDNVSLQDLTDTPVAFNSATTAGALQAVIGKTLTTAGTAWNATSNPYTKDGTTTNVAITLKKVDSSGSISTDSADKYVLKTKVEDKVDVDTAWHNVNSTGSTPATFTVDKEDGKTRIADLKTDTSTGAKNLDVTGSVLVFPVGTEKVTVDENTNLKGIEGTVGKAGTDGLVIGDGRVTYVDVDNGNVELSDGKVGDITTAEDVPGTTDDAGDVTVNSGSTGKIDTHNLASAAVKIYGGTVGDVYSKSSIEIDANDSDTNVTTGQLKAPSETIYSDEATVTVGSILAQADDGTIYLTGSDVAVKAINLDSRNTNLILGDDNNAFTGSIPAPTNATNATFETSNSDTTAKVSGDLKVDTINLDSDTTATFDGNITADTIEGDGTMVIKAGNLYVSGSVSSTRLKLSDPTLAAGTTVFKADSDAVDTSDFDTYGFTLAKSQGTNVDTFKIDTLSFAGLQINKSSSTIAKGYSETFTASAYPGGTSLPEGYTIGWELDGGSSDVFALTTADNTATVTVNSIDPDFASENKTTLTATLYDADGYAVDTSDYGNATCDITAVALPPIVSDTTSNFSIAPGASYTFKITSATQPVVTAGTAGVFTVTDVGKSGNDYFVKITAIGKVGAEAGIYVNGAKLLVASIKSGITSDTTSDITVKKGASYTYKITAPSAPTFAVGTANVLTYKLTSQSGNNYFYQITAVGAAGAKAGVYVNGQKINAVTVG